MQLLQGLNAFLENQTGITSSLQYPRRDVAQAIEDPHCPIFSISNTVSHEDFVDRVLHVLFHQLDHRYADSRCTFDLGNWLQYFAFDVMGTLTFSKRYGFLEQGCDVNGMLVINWNYMTDAASFTQIPWFDNVWRKNLLAAALKDSTGFSILQVVDDFLGERQRKAEDTDVGEKGVPFHQKDMLSLFLELSKTNDPVPPQ